MTEHVEVLIPEEDVNRRITEVAEEINRDYHPEEYFHRPSRDVVFDTFRR